MMSPSARVQGEGEGEGEGEGRPKLLLHTEYVHVLIYVFKRRKMQGMTGSIVSTEQEIDTGVNAESKERW